MKIGNKLMRKLGYVPYADAEYWKRLADNDSSLAADLVEQCRELSTQVDEFADENNKLREKLAASGAEVARLRQALDEIRMHVDDYLDDDD